MKLLYWLFAGLLVLVAIIAFIPSASATCSNSAAPNANACHGFSMAATTTGGVATGRCMAFHLGGAGTLTCSTTGVGSTTADFNTAWNMAAGDCTTIRYDDVVSTGSVFPAAPNKVGLVVRADNTATNVRIYLTDAAEPANGSTYQFCSTNDGTSTGSPRAGTYRILGAFVKDNGVGGVGNYNINTDGLGSPSSFNKGGLRGGLIVDTLLQSAYPSGSTFAYGPSVDETITVSATFTTPNIDAGVETMRTGILDSITMGGGPGEVGATIDVDTGSISQSTYVVDNTYAFANNPWVPAISLQGNSVSMGNRWTYFPTTGHGSGIIYLSDTAVINTNTFNIDSRIKMDSDGAGGFASADETDRSYAGGTCSGSLIEVFNRGENACTAWSIVNARDEYLTRSMTHARYDSVPTLCSNYGSLTPTSGVYSVSGSFSTSATCLAAADITGSARYLVITNTDQSYTSGTVYSISSLLFVDAHLQISSSLTVDDYPTPDATEDLEYFVRSDGGGGDDSDTIHLWCGVQGVRQDLDVDTSGSAVSRNIKDPSTTTRASDTTDTGANGFTSTSLNLLATTPLGDNWTGFCSAIFAGNTGSDTETFAVSVEGGGGIVEEILHVGDPLKVFCEYYALNESVLCTISESYLDGTARTGNAANTDVYLYAPDHSLVVNGDQPIEVAFGTYYYEYSNATEGTWLALIRTMNETGVDIGTSNLFTIDFTLLEHRETSLELFSMENVILLLFFALLIIAEWKKDLMYHLMVVILGISLVATDLDTSLRMVIVALMVYQIYRAYLVSKTARNSLDNPANKED